MAQDPDSPMAQDPYGDDNDDGTFTKVDKYFPNMGMLTSSAGLFLKNPTKTTAI